MEQATQQIGADGGSLCCMHRLLGNSRSPFAQTSLRSACVVNIDQRYQRYQRNLLGATVNIHERDDEYTVAHVPAMLIQKILGKADRLIAEVFSWILQNPFTALRGRGCAVAKNELCP